MQPPVAELHPNALLPNDPAFPDWIRRTIGPADFDDQDGDDVRVLRPFGVAEEHPAKTILFREGDPAFALYIIEEGEVACSPFAYGDRSPRTTPRARTMPHMVRGLSLSFPVQAPTPIGQRCEDAGSPIAASRSGSRIRSWPRPRAIRPRCSSSPSTLDTVCRPRARLAPMSRCVTLTASDCCS